MSVALEFFRDYRDRGKMKYMGFYLSEHTTALAGEKSIRGKFIEGKREMSSNEIYHVLNQAYLNSEPVAIQLNEKSTEGIFQNDYIGRIFGYDDKILYVGNSQVPLDEIRNIELLTLDKWSKI